MKPDRKLGRWKAFKISETNGASLQIKVPSLKTKAKENTPYVDISFIKTKKFSEAYFKCAP